MGDCKMVSLFNGKKLARVDFVCSFATKERLKYLAERQNKTMGAYLRDLINGAYDASKKYSAKSKRSKTKTTPKRNTVTRQQTEKLKSQINQLSRSIDKLKR
jgi:hypothetical protein